MEKQKQKIESTFKTLESRLEESGKLAATDRRHEVRQLQTTIKELDTEIQRFQRNAYMKYPDECEEFEQRCSDLSHKLDQLAEAGAATGQPMDSRSVDEEMDSQAGVNQWQVQQTNDKLKEGKGRALAMLQTVNNMKEEINQIDDEVMFQREKLLGVTEKLKDTQSLLKQTKRLVGFFSKAVYEDLIIKILIGLIALAVVVILVMAIRIKVTKSGIEKTKIASDEELLQSVNYDDIDENEFMQLVSGELSKKAARVAADKSMRAPLSSPPITAR